MFGGGDKRKSKRSFKLGNSNMKELYFMADVGGPRGKRTADLISYNI
jgi:hypothetical protein